MKPNTSTPNAEFSCECEEVIVFCDWFVPRRASFIVDRQIAFRWKFVTAHMVRTFKLCCFLLDVYVFSDPKRVGEHTDLRAAVGAIACCDRISQKCCTLVAECWVILMFLPHQSVATGRHTHAAVIDTCQHNVHTSLFTVQYREMRDVFVLLLLLGFWKDCRPEGKGFCFYCVSLSVIPTETLQCISQDLCF